MGIAYIIDSQIIREGNAIRMAVIFFYISNEGISILENTAKIGLPIPKKLKDILEQLNKDEVDEGDEVNEGDEVDEGDDGNG